MIAGGPGSEGNDGGSAGREEAFSSASDSSAEQDRSRFEPLTRDLAALQAYVLHYVSARSDALRAKAKRLAVYAALGLMGLAVGVTAIVVAVTLALYGIAHALAAATDRLWLGELLAGFGVLVLVGLAGWLGTRYWLRLSLKQTKEKYERRRIKERIQYGRDVAQRAAP
jgi:hypothetical protein